MNVALGASAMGLNNKCFVLLATQFVSYQKGPAVSLTRNFSLPSSTCFPLFQAMSVTPFASMRCSGERGDRTHLSYSSVVVASCQPATR